MSASEETKEPAESKTVEKMAEDEVILHKGASINYVVQNYDILTVRLSRT